MKSVLSFWRSAQILSLLLMVFGAAHTVSAQIDIGYTVTNKYDLPTIGVARGQQARLNVFYHNIFPPGPCVPGERCFPPGPCAPGESCSFNVSLSFADCDGNIVARNDINLVPDRGGSILFTPSSFMSDGRACARATVTVQPDANGNLPDLAPTVDILDAATGQSSLINPGSIRGFNPQPEPPGNFDFGLFNVVKGQTARVSVAFVGVPDGFPPGPCRVTMRFYGGDGQQISESTIPLNPGQTGQFDFPTTNFPNGARARIRASVHVDPSENGLIAFLMPAVEVFAADTGKGALYYPGAMIGGH
jgi:hypothetical protein